jgi:hypothetical protein
MRIEGVDEVREEVLTPSHDIDPSVHLYPTYSHEPLRPVETYYRLTNAYPKNFFEEKEKRIHKEKFTSTLVEIRKGWVSVR